MTEQQKRGTGLQVIHAGLFRTATKSMAEAYKILGYKTHHALSDDPQHTPWDKIAQAAEATWPNICVAQHPRRQARALFTREEWDDLLLSSGDWDIWTDIASPFAPQLIEAYPEAKVVIVQRDFETWWPSFEAQIVKPLFYPSGGLLAVFARYLLGTHAMWALGRVLFGMFDATRVMEIEAHARSTYERYYRRVRYLVPPERRLEYRMGDGWEPLCEFLGKDVPDVPFPWVNDRSFQEDLEMRRARWIRIIKVIAKWAAVGIAVVAWCILRQ